MQLCGMAYDFIQLFIYMYKNTLHGCCLNTHSIAVFSHGSEKHRARAFACGVLYPVEQEAVVGGLRKHL